MNTIQQTYRIGQATWLDYIRRSFLTSGDLSQLIEMGVVGITSNPTIFEKAITGSADYDRTLSRLMEEGLSAWEICDQLTREDVAMAADILKPVFDRTEGVDGYVSLEVSPELAHDTRGTVREGIRLFSALGRPNIMIKVPATPAGFPAIEQLIEEGVNVNVTLIFSLKQYQEAARAYIQGLKKRASGGKPVDGISSVASFFVSRVDTAVDQLLHRMGGKDLQGRAAVANAKLAYAEFSRIFSGPDWEALLRKGARLQRPLWASTSRKNPAYPDTVYVDSLIGEHTVNTMPMETLAAFLDHGTTLLTLTENQEDAARHMESLEALGIDMGEVTRDLLEKGVKSFADSFISLIAGIGQKIDSLGSGRHLFSVHAAGYSDLIEKALDGLKKEQVMGRLWEHDYTLWKDDPREVTNRLGWLSSPFNMKGVVGQIRNTVDEIRRDGYTDALVLGMGGSSLAPDLFSRAFDVLEGFLNLKVLDSTDPAAVGQQSGRMDPARSLFVISSKSGTTTETLSHFKYFYNLTMKAVGKEEAGKHFIAITDPGSPLASMASDLRFRQVFLNDPDIGGRYSALSYFGLVPAALMGINIDLLLDRAMVMLSNCEPANQPGQGDNTGAILGAVMGALQGNGVDKLTLLTSPSISPLGAWLEQLLAESTGKRGKGIVPVDGEFPGRPDFYGKDRLFVYLRIQGDMTFDEPIAILQNAGHPVVSIQLADLYDIGGEFFRWEVATAVAAHLMKINPFDQPDVESAKILARRMLGEYIDRGQLPGSEPVLAEQGVEVYSDTPSAALAEALGTFLQQAQPGDYVALQAYVEPSVDTTLALEEFRHRIRDTYRVATTLGFGPRFLHSTGQLHKGDGGHGLFIQITTQDAQDIPIPDESGKDASSVTFGVLKAAQAMGDRQALLDAGRRVIRFHLKGDVPDGIRLLKGKLG